MYRSIAPLSVFACMLVAAVSSSYGDDWPMWRRDARRTAATSEKLPEELHLRWVRELPKLTPAYREPRLQFDAGYEPIVMGRQMFVASSYSDSVTALELDSGQINWTFYAGGAIRFAPVASEDRVIFGSDDGYLYCVDSDNGELRWKFQAVPSQRKVLSGGRMISLWPVRGGPVLNEGKVFFAAGVWPFEGVFIYCLDAASGEVVWRNDDASFVYGQHPHAAQAIGGVTPQGYLVVSGDELIVPCGQALPAKFDIRDGKLLEFELPRPGRQPGGWFASAAVRRGEVALDAEVNQDLHEDRVYQGPGVAGIRKKITVGGRTLRFEDGFPGIDGDIHTMLVANGNLGVVTTDGNIYCFGAAPDSVARYSADNGGHRHAGNNHPMTQQMLGLMDARHGYLLIRNGRESGEANDDTMWRQRLQETIDITATILAKSDFHIVLTDTDERLLNRLRQHYKGRRDRICLLSEAEESLGLPPYFATSVLTISSALPNFDEFDVLRPNGGVSFHLLSEPDHASLKQQMAASLDSEFSIERVGEITAIRRGGLRGAANYTGSWSSPDTLVRAPLGVLWFDDALGHFKRSPQPWFVDGVMVSYPKDWMEKHRANRKPPYDLLPPVYSDVYTGRVLPTGDAIVADIKLPERTLGEPQPNQYRPPTQLNAWRPVQPVIGNRINPLTGESEPRKIPKSYGCDGGVDYGHIFTMRSGTPAFYDKRLESGVCSISGPRSGCTNSIIPAGGVLNVPFFYEGCTCSYPLPVGLALVSMPPSHEQWFSWGEGTADNIQRVGINFGAPGDRMTESGTLWLDYPSRGGPSPAVSVSVEPRSAEYFYRHSLFVENGDAWPWVGASGVSGVEKVTIDGLRSGTYQVHLCFLDPTQAVAGQRVFDVKINGEIAASNIDIAKRAGGKMRTIVQTARCVVNSGQIELAFDKQAGTPQLSGVELIRQD